MVALYLNLKTLLPQQKAGLFLQQRVDKDPEVQSSQTKLFCWRPLIEYGSDLQRNQGLVIGTFQYIFRVGIGRVDISNAYPEV